jgi:hypothetical protein
LGSDAHFEVWKAATEPGAEVARASPHVQFFFHMGFAISRWAIVDRNLFDVFHMVLRSNSDAVASYLFYKSANISDHFAATDSLVNLSVNAKQATAWAEIARAFNDESILLFNFRNRLAHDPVTQIVSAVGIAGEPRQPIPRPPQPSWEIYREGAKLLGSRKRPKDILPVTVDRIIAHIEDVTKLAAALEQFKKHLPKKRQARPLKSVAPKPPRKKAQAKKSHRQRAKGLAPLPRSSGA